MRRALADEIAEAAAFRRALRRFLRRTEEATAAAGLSPQRYNLLLMIKAAELGGEAASVSRLVGELELPQTAVSELVRRAEEAGLVTRTRSVDDGRVALLGLTREGEQRLMAAFAALRDDRAEVTGVARGSAAAGRGAER